ncbi:MAG: ribose-5-phosphate isomerase A, partial [Pseudomonadales bacterium]
ADEADPNLALIKGGGAALTQEKIVASAAETFYCLVDESKCVETLGAFPLPIEYIELAEAPLRRSLAARGAEGTRRAGVTTDNGHPIIDVRGLDLRDPTAQEQALNQWPGVVCNGLFALRRADQLFVASPRGVTVKTAPR